MTLDGSHPVAVPGRGLVEGSQAVEMNLEVVVVPVSDVDRAKDFYLAPGWPATGVTSATPGSAEGLQLVVTDIEAAGGELESRGAQVTFDDRNDQSTNG